MSIAEIDAMSDQDVADLMGATVEELAAGPAWMWREAAKVATEEWADKLVSDVESGRAKVISDPSEIRRRLGGRPRVGGAEGEGPSMQVRVRVTTGTRTALETIAAAQGRRLADVSREALDEYVARHAS
jgi:kynureninase